MLWTGWLCYGWDGCNGQDGYVTGGMDVTDRMAMLRVGWM